MFLTRGIIPYEDTWRQFLKAVPERVPGAAAAGWRALFSMYVHLPPDLVYPEGSLFAGHEIAERIPVEWGQWSVVRPDTAALARACLGTQVTVLPCIGSARLDAGMRRLVL